MKFEVANGTTLGTIEFQGPGRVEFDMPDERQRSWFERYFHAEDSVMNGPLGGEQMSCERRDDSPEAFERAVYELAAYSYSCTRRDEPPT